MFPKDKKSLNIYIGTPRLRPVQKQKTKSLLQQFYLYFTLKHQMDIRLGYNIKK